MPVQVHKALCPQNHHCPAMHDCPVDAITQRGVAAPEIDADKCIECEKCVMVCPTGALEMAWG